MSEASAAARERRGEGELEDGRRGRSRELTFDEKDLLPVTWSVDEFDFCFGHFSDLDLLHSRETSSLLKFRVDARDSGWFFWMDGVGSVRVLIRFRVKEHPSIVDVAGVGDGSVLGLMWLLLIGLDRSWMRGEMGRRRRGGRGTRKSRGSCFRLLLSSILMGRRLVARRGSED